MKLHRETTDANEDPLRDDEVMIIQVHVGPGGGGGSSGGDSLI